MASKRLEHEEIWRFVLAGTSCMCAAFVTNPIDVIKIRMQLESELAEQKGFSHLKNRYYDGWIKGCSTIIRDEGFLGLYKGLTPSLMREGIYSTIRLGAYEPLKRFLGARDPAHTPLWKKICSGAISGAIGSSIATPTDLVKVRMQAQRKQKEGEIARYRNTFTAFKEIYMMGGVRGLYVGVGPTVKRAAILTATQSKFSEIRAFYGHMSQYTDGLMETTVRYQDMEIEITIPTYDHTKHLLLNAGLMVEGVLLHVTASMIAGFVTALTTSPVDVIKTRVMNQCQITKPYSSAFDCFWKTLRTEGPLGLYKGFIPNWMRLGPHTIVTFFVFEQLRRLVGMAPV